MRNEPNSTTSLRHGCADLMADLLEDRGTATYLAAALSQPRQNILEMATGERRTASEAVLLTLDALRRNSHPMAEEFILRLIRESGYTAVRNGADQNPTVTETALAECCEKTSRLLGEFGKAKADGAINVAERRELATAAFRLSETALAMARQETALAEAMERDARPRRLA